MDGECRDEFSIYEREHSCEGCKDRIFTTIFLKDELEEEASDSNPQRVCESPYL